MKESACLIIILAWLIIMVSCSKQHAIFHTVEEEESSARRKLITSFESPSELACSQKCLHHGRCEFKKYDLQTKRCDLLEEFEEEDIEPDVILTKIGMCSNESTSECKLKPDDGCGENCYEMEDVCDCRDKGVYESCSAALSANDGREAVYWIFPPGMSHLIAIECMKGKDGGSFVVFHHDNESTVLVNGYEDAGSYNHTLRYDIEMQAIIAIVNKSSSCKQHTDLSCYNAIFTGSSWLSGRNGRKLEYWGGGPSSGSGCACGMTNTCASLGRKCNCDKNDRNWRADKGFVTKKEDLPITAMNVGDTGHYSEKVKYTIGPLLCVL